MVELILVRTGDKFDEWYVDNLLYMVEKYGNLKFRIVAPSKDIEVLSKDLKTFLKKKLFVVEKYLKDPLHYYCSALIVVLPTDK